MKLYLLSQDENDGYDTYDSAVVVAASEATARQILPTGKWFAPGKPVLGYAWASRPENVKVVYLGEAKSGLKAGTVLCASFNAG